MSIKLKHLSLLLLCSFLCLSVNAQTVTKSISGIVLDEKEEPVIGATVAVKGTSTGVMTDLDGRFELEVPTKGVFTVSYLGYRTQEITIGNTSEYRVVLEENELSLDEVVVIGYGTAKKRDLTGAISSLRTDKLQTEAPRSVQDLLRANVAGLNIGVDGKAKGASSLMIRGKGTLKDGGEPLIVVDGVIYDGDLSDLNPNDIASVDVLKDASSAAVYGAKSGYGVIVIMTQKGKNTGKPVVNFNASMGWVTMADQRKVLSPEGYIKMRQDLKNGSQSDADKQRFPQMYTDPRKLDGVSQLDWYNYNQGTPVPSVTEEELLLAWVTRLDFSTPEQENFLAGKTTNWENQVFHTGVQQDYSASISNRNEQGSYYWSVGWQDRESLYVGDRFTRLTSRLNLESNINKYITIGMNMNFAMRNEGYLTADWGQARRLSPYAANTIGIDGDPYQLYPTGDTASKNPFYDNLYTDRKEKITTLNGTMFGRLNLPYGFEYQVNFTPHLRWKEFFNHNSTEHIGRKEADAERTHEKWSNWQVDNVFRWKMEFDKKHNVEFTGLINAEKNQFWRTESRTSQFRPNDQLGYHHMGAGTIPKAYSNDTYNTRDALMGRLFYSYMNKYMLTTSVRRDGYSAFGKDNPHATFPAVALGWVFTGEKFGEKLAPWMTYGKLRFSWGENGNSDIGSYAALADLTSGLTPIIDTNGNIELISQLYVKKMANYSLKWENTESYNLGLDFSIFHDILGGSIDIYKKETNDLLVTRELPRVSGYQNIEANLGKIDNKGIEISLNAKIMKIDNFEWHATGTFSLNRRKLTKLYGDKIDIVDEFGNVIGQREADDTKNSWFIGRDPDQIYGYVRDGVWQIGEETEAAKYGLQPGDFKYVDQDGDGLLTDKDKRFQKYKTPRFRWSLRNNFRIYNDFELSFMVYSLWGQHNTFNDAANNWLAERESNYDYPRWTPENPINDYARIKSNNKGTNWVNRSFIRLDNITLSYYVPQKFLSRFLVKDMRLTGSIRNVAVFAPDWKNNWDAETGEPYGRTFTIGVNFTL
ncbi:SusC/RagA family TonB-linked outer membrane protein [Dysgonomonas sp. 25]|uniref:SusC/RagA family TonB-linked outer membrane protein n=1 Tax=Dysgonomonas sp. 25 TaxID=2302933 RepID=UPI0013D5253D|nr:SusC/RagA family TonB-linked outer membrane protein [Dysgonomonas sp. 25]NDV67417.1 SusC/RagA family TonB-linked outer membrane protein [Dysgonomonas sp. 25]